MILNKGDFEYQTVKPRSLKSYNEKQEQQNTDNHKDESGHVVLLKFVQNPLE